MDFKVNSICGKYHEVEVDKIHSGTLDDMQAVEIARNMINAAEDLLWQAGSNDASDACRRVLEYL